MQLLILTRSELNSAGALVATTTACAIAACILGDLKACLLIVLALVGQLSMMLLIWLAHRSRQRSTRFPVRKIVLPPWIALLLAWCSAKAAIIFVAIAIGVGVGLIGWAGVKILDAINEIHERQIQNKDQDIQQVDIVDPGIDIANDYSAEYVANIRPSSVNDSLTAGGAGIETPAHSFSIPVPANSALETSPDMQHWTTVYYNGGSSEDITYWNASEPTGYFRLRFVED